MNVEQFIKENKHNVYYCEAIIYPDGQIENATPSHTYKLIDISGKSQDEINEIMPMTAGPVAWLVDYTECVALWYNFGMLPENFTDAQQRTIDILKENNILSPEFSAIKNYEMRICDMNHRLTNAKTDEEFNNVKNEMENFWENR